LHETAAAEPAPHCTSHEARSVHCTVHGRPSQVTVHSPSQATAQDSLPLQWMTEAFSAATLHCWAPLQS